MTDQPLFPLAQWGYLRARFDPSSESDDGMPIYAVVVFAWGDGGWLLANIPGRGWTVPSGRLEQGETSTQAAVRETREEAGAELEGLRHLGRFTLIPPDGAALTVAAFVGRVARLDRLPEGSESEGVRFARPAELPQVYYAWDDLLDRVFAYALEQVGRRE